MGLRLLLISGSLRSTSTNTAALRTLAEVVPYEIDCWLYEELGELPAFNPDFDRAPWPPAVKRLRDAIHRADAVMFSTPEYAGHLPGSFKNLLDWSIGDDHACSIYEKPVGWINTSPRAATGAYAELRTVLGYAHARVIDAACVKLSITLSMIGADGRIAGSALRMELSQLAETLVARIARCSDLGASPLARVFWTG